MGKEPGPSDGSGGIKYQEKHAHIIGRGLISSSALGLSDGLITNLAFLTGFSGAVSNIEVVRFAGLAALLAGSVSMFFGGVLSARSESDLFKADAAREAYEIEHEPDEEVWELKNLYMEKGLTEEESEMVVRKISADRGKFLEDMLANELHISRSNLQEPYKVGATVGLSFLVGAAVPVIPYYLLSDMGYAVALSVVLSFAFLFAAGAWKGVIVKREAWRSGLETLLIGAAAAGALYLIGRLFEFV